MSVPQDVMNVHKILEEYGFTPENCDPRLINQIFAIVNETATNFFQHADLVRETIGEGASINVTSLDYVLSPPNPGSVQAASGSVPQSTTTPQPLSRPQQQPPTPNNQSITTDHSITSTVAVITDPTTMSRDLFSLQASQINPITIFAVSDTTPFLSLPLPIDDFMNAPNSGDFSIDY